jgi:dimethylglycine dehydrogenase
MPCLFAGAAQKTTSYVGGLLSLPITIADGENVINERFSQMRTHAQAVVIGGGVIGCSILYHLAKLGWTDVVLLERDELTSGSTWHAAANIHGLHDSTNISRIQHYTMNLYNALEEETGQSCGVFQPGSLYLAQT